jgi:hypothetical protein
MLLSVLKYLGLNIVRDKFKRASSVHLKDLPRARHVTGSFKTRNSLEVGSRYETFNLCMAAVYCRFANFGHQNGLLISVAYYLL